MTHRIFTTPFSSVYPAYVAKAERKGRTREEVDAIILWLTGHTPAAFAKHLDKKTTVEDFLMKAPQWHAHSELITGVVCGIRVETVEDPIMKRIRQLDKLIDELAKGKALEKILR